MAPQLSLQVSKDSEHSVTVRKPQFWLGNADPGGSALKGQLAIVLDLRFFVKKVDFDQSLI